MEVAAQQAIAGVTLILHNADHAPHRHTHQRERMAGQHQGTLNRFRHHLGCPGRLEALDVAVVDGPHDNRHARCVRLHVTQDLQGGSRVVIADDHRIGPRQPGGHQALQPCRIAEHDALPGGSGLPNPVRIEVERHVGYALPLQQPSQVLTTSAIAGDDDVSLGVDRALGNRGHRHRLHQPVVGAQAHHDAVAVQDQQRRRQHAQHHARQHRAQPLGVDELLPGAHAEQNETELPRLGEVQAGAQRDPGCGPEDARQQCNQHKLRQHRPQGQQQHQEPFIPDGVPIQLHADRDEEQAQQDVVKWPDVGFNLVLVFGLRDQHARQKCTQRE